MRILLTFIFFMLLFGYILRLLSPFIMRRIMKRMEKKITGQFNNTANKKKTRREGQIIIEQTDRKEKKVDKNIGDYVDFEEEN
ncbi:MAG: DUF4834 family protein [Prevotellaceae bacterium]|nr:DUF4834 family protein [Prevotellaceae bacterium]